MATRNDRIHTIIHTTSAGAAAVGGGLAQIPGSDMPVLCGLQANMIRLVAAEHGAKISETTAMGLLMTFAAGYGGRVVSQWLVGWIPGLGNVINAATAASITEAVGWAADAYFEQAEAA